MKRINVTEVVEAFKEIKAIPAKGDYINLKEGKLCCCGLGAIFLKNTETYLKKHVELDDVDLDDVDISKYFDDEYGSMYRVGFVHGFDGVNNDSSNRHLKVDEKYRLGFADGHEAYKAVTKEEN